jgi:hypothetical protein
MESHKKQTLQGIGILIIIFGFFFCFLFWILILHPGIIIVGILVVIFAVLCHLLRGIYIRYLWERKWAGEGKRVLIVYSRSPNWKEYIESKWIEQLGSHLVILDWSDRSKWTKPFSLEVKAFKYWGGARAFNPIAILFPKRGRVRVIRFWKPFRDYRHGKIYNLQKAEDKLFTFVNNTSSTAA